MSEDFLVQQPTAMWNPARGVWETMAVNLLCGHLEPFSETWPTSGMMRDGRVYGLPMREHLTTVSGSLLLRSPKASEGGGGALGEAEALRRGNTVGVRDQVMDLVAGQGLKVSRQENNLLFTPRQRDHKTGDANADTARARIERGFGLDIAEAIGLVVEGALLPTVTASEANGVGAHGDGGQDLRTTVDALLPTVTTQDGKNNGGPSQAVRNTPPQLPSVVLLPTPVAAEGLKAPAQQNSKTKSKTGQVWLSNIAKDIEELNE